MSNNDASDTTFAALAERLSALRSAMRYGKVFIGADAKEVPLWGSDKQDRLKDILRQTLRLLDLVDSRQSETYRAQIGDQLQEHFGHRANTVGFIHEDAEPVEPTDDVIECEYEAFSAFARRLYELLKVLSDEFPEAYTEAPHPDTPEGRKEYIRRRLGRKTMQGLDNYVTAWRKQFGKDLPWVIRKPGLPWMPDMKLFETWCETSEGEKATVKKGPGRPPKKTKL